MGKIKALYSSHGHWAMIKEFEELEVQDRLNYTWKEFDKWKKEHGIIDTDLFIWGCADPLEANSYNYAASERKDIISGKKDYPLNAHTVYWGPGNPGDLLFTPNLEPYKGGDENSNFIIVKRVQYPEAYFIVAIRVQDGQRQYKKLRLFKFDRTAGTKVKEQLHEILSEGCGDVEYSRPQNYYIYWSADNTAASKIQWFKPITLEEKEVLEEYLCQL